MDFQGIWHEHRDFILKVGVGALVYTLLIGYAIQVADEAQAAALKNERSLRKYREIEEALANVEGREKGRSESLAKVVEPQALGMLLWKLAPKKQLKGNEANRYLAFTEKRRRASLAIRAVARERNVPLPKSFGFLAKEDEALIKEHLVRLDLTESVLVALLQNGATKILGVRQLAPADEKLPLKWRDKSRLRRIPMLITVEGPPALLPKTFAGFRKPGRFVELLSFRVEQARRRSGERLRMELTISVMVLSEDAVGANSAGVGEIGDPGPVVPVGPTPVGPRPLRRFGGGRRR